MSRIIISSFGESAVGAAAAAAVEAANALARAHGEAAVSKNEKSLNDLEEAKNGISTVDEISLGSVIRVILLKASMNGEMSVRVPLIETLRCLRYAFPLSASNSAPDRLKLDEKIREEFIFDLCALFEIKDSWPFTQGCRNDMKRARQKLEREQRGSCEAGQCCQRGERAGKDAVRKGKAGRRGTLAAAGFHAALADDGHNTSDEDEKDLREPQDHLLILHSLMKSQLPLQRLKKRDMKSFQRSSL